MKYPLTEHNDAADLSMCATVQVYILKILTVTSDKKLVEMKVNIEINYTDKQ